MAPNSLVVVSPFQEGFKLHVWCVLQSAGEAACQTGPAAGYPREGLLGAGPTFTELLAPSKPSAFKTFSQYMKMKLFRITL